MKIPRVVFFMARFCFAFFVLLTAAYCLLTYIPFTYQQIHVGGLLPWVTAFVEFHPYLYWGALAAAALTTLKDLHDSKTRIPTLAFLFFYGTVGVVLLFHPLLAGLRNDTQSIVWSMAALLPLVWLAAIDWLGQGRHLVWSEPQSGEDHRVFQAVWQSAIYLSLLYAAIFYVRFILSRTVDFGGAQWFLTVTWSLISHLLLFMAMFLVLNLVGAVANLFVRRSKAEFLCCTLLAVFLVWLIIKFLIFPPLSFVGYLASAVAFAVAISIVVFSTGVSVRLYRAEEGPIESGLALLLMPTRFLRFVSRPARVWFILLIPGIAYYLAMKTGAMDWEYLLQKLAVLFIWTVTFATFYTMAHRTDKPRGATLLFAVATATLGVYMTLRAFQPRWQVLVRGTQADVAGVLDEYADYDVSFRLVHETLSRRATSILSRSDAGDSFYSFLGENTNIPRSTRVDPVEVNLVTNLAGTNKDKPGIFLFVIDSLRRDYLSPYNPSVTFTPAIEAFASESVVLENAFTQYGGTGLSEPCIWVGGMVLHKQYITPFYPMNALQKLIEAEKYQCFVSKDQVLNTVMAPSPSVIELDQDMGTMYYDFCTTLRELVTKISGRTDPARPIFAYTQPQNIHVSVIDREGRSTPPGERYTGFDAPYASRIRRMDRCFGEFIQFMKKSGLYANSIIVLTSDHGDSLGERGRMGHAYTLFPEIIRVPLIIHLPPTLRATVSFNPRSVAFLTDIAPTLYYLLGHQPIVQNNIFGRPLFTAKLEEQTRYLRDSYLIVSSYAPVYGILSSNGRSLYIADGVSYKNYFYDLGEGPSSASKPVTDFIRAEHEEMIRDHIRDINRFYRFAPPQ